MILFAISFVVLSRYFWSHDLLHTLIICYLFMISFKHASTAKNGKRTRYKVDTISAFGYKQLRRELIHMLIMFLPYLLIIWWLEKLLSFFVISPLSLRDMEILWVSLAQIHKGGLSTNLGFRTSYDAFYAFFTNLVCKEQKEVWRNKRRFELKPWSELKPCFVNSGQWVS